MGWMVGQRHTPAALPLGMTPVPTVWEAVWYWSKDGEDKLDPPCEQ